MSDSKTELIEKLNQCTWKDGLTKKGMTVNSSKTKIMVGGEKTHVAVSSSRWPCVVSKLVAIQYGV